MAPRANIRIAEVKPTVLLIQSGTGLLQGVDLTLRSGQNLEHVRVTGAVGKDKQTTELSSLPEGESTHRIWIPETRKKTKLAVRVAAGNISATKTLPWEPPRHWTVYLCQTAHFDPGYTGLPSTVMEEYLGFLDDVVEYCDRTADWPFESQFRYTVEQAWIADHYVNNRPPDQAERFAELCRQGRIQVNALYGNNILEIMGSEETARLLYPAFRLKAKYGIPISCAQHNDIPGITWGLITALAGAGVKYFSPGIPTYFSWGDRKYRDCFDHDALRPNDVPSFWYWKAPNGAKVLVHLSIFGASGPCEPTLAFLPDLLSDVQQRGYRYDFFLLPMNGGHRDNAPPNFYVSPGARDWSARYAFPKVVVATEKMFFDTYAGKLGKLPTFQGDFPGTDYCVGATSTAALLGVSRETKEMLSSAERFAAVADMISQYPYPARNLTTAHDEVLRFDEHVWGTGDLTGPGQNGALAELALYGRHAHSLAHTELVRVTNAIADRINLDKNQHIIVFNSEDSPRTDVVALPWRADKAVDTLMYTPGQSEPRRGPVQYCGHVYGRHEFDLDKQLMDGRFELVDAATEKNVPFQIVKINTALEPVAHAGQRVSKAMARPEFAYALLFLAEDVPSLGYRTYKIIRRDKASSFSSALKATRKSLENEFFRVEVDPKSGAVTSIFDKELERELVDRRSKVKCNQFLARNIFNAKIQTADRSKVTVKRKGPVSVSLLVTGDAPGCPQRAQEIILYAGLKRIDFNNRILKDATADLQIHYAFPFAVSKPRFRYDAPLATIHPITDQLPGTCTDYYAVQRWVAVTEGTDEWGLLWSSRHAPMVRFSKLWPDYVSQAHHNLRPAGFIHGWLTDPDQFTRGHLYSYVLTNNFGTNFNPCQVGDVLTSYSLTTHSGGFDPELARSFGGMVASSLHPIVVQGGKDWPGGPLETTEGFVEVDSPKVRILALKRAEDGDGLVLRLHNDTDEDTVANVRLPFAGDIFAATRANLVEEPTGEILKVWNDTVSVPLPAGDVATIRVLPSRWR